MSNSGVRWTRKDTSVLKRLIRETPERVDAVLRGIATEIVSDIVVSFPASPSPEGGPPGVDTGTLRASIRWTPEGNKIYVHDGVEYGVHLEMGTERMGARPFVAPQFESWTPARVKQYLLDTGVFK
jgi:hypothetical protein